MAFSIPTCSIIYSVYNFVSFPHLCLYFSASNPSLHDYSSSIATTQPPNPNDAKAPTKRNIIQQLSNSATPSHPAKLQSIRAEEGSFHHPPIISTSPLHQRLPFCDGFPSHINRHQTTRSFSPSCQEPTCSHYCFNPATGSASRRHRTAALNSAGTFGLCTSQNPHPVSVSHDQYYPRTLLSVHVSKHAKEVAQYMLR